MWCYMEKETHSESKVKYYAYACNTHLKKKDQCSMQFIREKSFEVAFLNMINKLAFTKKVLLQPLLQVLKPLTRKQQSPELISWKRLLRLISTKGSSL